MTSFLDRIRARTRRQNAKRVKRARALGRSAAVLEPLSLDGDQVTAIQGALADQSLEPVQGAGTGEYTAPEQGATDVASDADSDAALVEVEVTTGPATKNTDDGQVEGGAQVDLITELTTEPAEDVELAPGAEVVSRAEFASSNVRAATLFADGVLVVDFKDGGKYSYGNFTPALFAEWQAAKSAGSWFHHNVRTKLDRHPVLKGE